MYPDFSHLTKSLHNLLPLYPHMYFLPCNLAVCITLYGSSVLHEASLFMSCTHLVP